MLLSITQGALLCKIVSQLSAYLWDVYQSHTNAWGQDKNKDFWNQNSFHIMLVIHNLEMSFV